MFVRLSPLAHALGAVAVLIALAQSAFACDVGCMPRPVALVHAPAVITPIETAQPALSWVFRRSTFTNDPVTGARVAQYARKDPVEPLDDQRAVTSSYRRMRSENRGRDGSIDTTYVVQAWGDGGGELGAQWQMFNDVWKEAILSGSLYNSQQAYGPWPRPRYFDPRWGGPWGGGQGGGPGWGGGWQGGGPGWQGGP